ncbi:unnamed protein product [Cuscuta epithymum]|uniref:Uncharacterized protein n=1 Tax=Cuscuta epithymum TaxID=186058 RepID=A0AAV0DZ34_9ASTE|nr:unnamed protein product [Cuscuta epithymum]
MTSVLGTQPGRRIRGMGDGRLREVGQSSAKIQQLSDELERERAARKASHMARIVAEEMMQRKKKKVEQSFNSTLMSWHNSGKIMQSSSWYCSSLVCTGFNRWW